MGTFKERQSHVDEAIKQLREAQRDLWHVGDKVRFSDGMTGVIHSVDLPNAGLEIRIGNVIQLWGMGDVEVIE